MTAFIWPLKIRYPSLHDAHDLLLRLSNGRRRIFCRMFFVVRYSEEVPSMSRALHKNLGLTRVARLLQVLLLVHVPNRRHNTPVVELAADMGHTGEREVTSTVGKDRLQIRVCFDAEGVLADQAVVVVVNQARDQGFETGVLGDITGG